MVCRFCSSERLRISSFHKSDVLWYLLLKLPVRCRQCQARFYVGLMEALKVRRAEMERRHEHQRQHRNRHRSSRAAASAESVSLPTEQA